MKSANLLAQRLGISRSQLFATALAEYVAKHESRKTTDRLNAVYTGDPSTLDPALHRAQRRSPARDSW